MSAPAAGQRDALADTLGLTERLRSIPIVEPGAVHQIGLVVTLLSLDTAGLGAGRRGQPRQISRLGAPRWACSRSH